MAIDKACRDSFIWTTGVPEPGTRYSVRARVVAVAGLGMGELWAVGERPASLRRHVRPSVDQRSCRHRPGVSSSYKARPLPFLVLRSPPPPSPPLPGVDFRAAR